MTDDEAAHARHLQCFGYTDLRYHPDHHWCGRQLNDACTGIQDDGSCVTRQDCGGGMEAVARVNAICAPKPSMVSMADYFATGDIT